MANHAAPTERIEIRILGPLRVRRADGTVVEPHEWRTGQTADLLRMLALHVGEPVSVDLLVEALWPKVDEVRGRASLRTAASSLRKVLGEDCVQRRLGGLVLTDVWVDAHAFCSLAHLARRMVVTGELAQAVTTTREADALYRGEFRAHHDTADWGLRERDGLAATFRSMIADAAEAAAALGWWHDAVDLAERTLAVEPCSERGYRALMRAEQGLGESSRALKTYDRCRRVIADEVGADPSAATQALYLELLADEPVAPAPTPFSGRAHEQDWLHELALTSAATREPTIVCVLGEAGAGKTRLVERAFAGSATPPHVIACATGSDPWSELVEAIGADLALPRQDMPRRGPVTVLLDDAHLLPAATVDQLADQLARLRGPVCVVLAARPTLADGRTDQLERALGARLSLLTLPPLATEEVAGLCAELLQGRVSDQLVAEVVAGTDGYPGRVLELVRGWTAGGRVAATSTGLVVLHGEVAGDLGTSVGRLLSDAVGVLSAAALEVLHLVAAFARPVPTEVLVPLTVDLRPTGSADDDTWLRATLDHLTDLTLLTSLEAGLTPRDPLLGDLILTWLRPSARRRLHRRIAERAHIAAAERTEHWLRAGEPQLARAASIEAAGAAVDEHEYESARLHLRELCRTSEECGVPPADRVELYERWGDAAQVLGRTHEARAAFAAGASLARVHRLPEPDRLEARSRRTVDVPAPTGRAHAPATSSTARPGLAAADGRQRDDFDLRRHRAVQDADAHDGPEARALARAWLVRDVCIPQRQLRAARRWTEQALSLTVDATACAQVLVAAWLGGAVLGEATATEEALGRAAALLGPEETVADLDALRCLAAHDLGRADFPALYAAAAAHGGFDDPLRHQWIAIRVATERHDFAAATAADALLTPASAPPVVRQLRACASAALAIATGRPDRAHGLLLDVLDVARATGSILLVPEAAARLVALEARGDLPSARRRFEQFEEAVGADCWLPRENVLKLLARAEIRAADGRSDDAASAAAAAADVAENAGLVLLSAQAHRALAGHLAAAGRGHEARLAATAAQRLLSAALPGAGPGSWADTDVVDITSGFGPRKPELFGRSDRADEAPAV